MNSFPGGSAAAGGALGPAEREASIAVLKGTADPGKELDILIVGGGIVGAGAALDAITRGLSVGIVEANDWAAGTSSRSSKLIHGGLRYLEMLDFAPGQGGAARARAASSPSWPRTWPGRCRSCTR